MTEESNPIRIDENGQIVIADRKIAEAVARALAALAAGDETTLRTGTNSPCNTNSNCNCPPE